MDPFTILGIAGAIGGIISSYSEQNEREEELDRFSTETQRVQQQLREQTQRNLRQLDLQKKQQVASFQQGVTERRLQGARALGGSQATLAARGLRGGSANRLLESVRMDTQKDIGVIQENLGNYLEQAELRRQQIEASGEAQISQYQSQLNQRTQQVEDRQPNLWNTWIPSIATGAQFLL